MIFFSAPLPMLGTISNGHQGASWEDHSVGGCSVQIKGGPSLEGTSPGSRPVSVLLLFSPTPATSQVQSRASPQVEPRRPAASGSSTSLGESRERSSLGCSPEQLETKHEALSSDPRVSRRLLGGQTVFSEQQAGVRTFSIRNGAGLRVTTQLSLCGVRPGMRALFPLSLSSPPALSPPWSPEAALGSVSEAAGHGSIPVMFKANSPVFSGKPDALPSTV